MRFEFSGKSGLNGRKVQLPIDRFAYVPKSEEGLQEYIFGYNQRIPTQTEEPDLYREAKVSQNNPDEVILRYDGLDEMVFLLTIEEDNKFRAQNPDVVSQNELFKLEQ